MQLPCSVEVVEVGPRDGLQNESVTVSTDDRIDLLKALTATGLKRFETTSFVSPKWIPQLADAAEVITRLPPTPGVIYGGLVPNERGYERARAVGIPDVVLVISATEGYSRANLNRTVVEVLTAIPILARRALDDGIHVRVSVSIAFGCPFDGTPDIERVVLAPSDIRATMRKETAYEARSCHLLDMQIAFIQKEWVETSMARIFRTDSRRSQQLLREKERPHGPGTP